MTQAGPQGLRPAASAEIAAIRVYQWTIRPFIGAHCRFWPSCSEYAIEALRRHGAMKGTVLATRRVLRCNPWHPGGIDPVPGADVSSQTNPCTPPGCDASPDGHPWDNDPQRVDTPIGRQSSGPMIPRDSRPVGH